MIKNSELKLVLEMMKEEKLNYIIGFVDVLIVSILGIFSSITIKYLVDDVLIANRPQYLWLIQGIFIALVFTQSIFNVRKVQVYSKASSGIINRLRRKMCKNLINGQYNHIQSGKRGNLLTAFQYDLDGLDDYFMNGIPEVIGSVITIVMTLGFMFLLNWQLTLLTIPIFPILLWLFSKFQKKVKIKSEKLQNSRKENIGLLNNIVDGIIMVKLFHLQDKYTDEYYTNGEKMQKNSVNLSILYLIMNLASWTLIMVPYQAIMYGVAGEWYFKSGIPTIGLMLSFANYANTLIGPFLSIQNCQRAWTYAKVCFNNIKPIIDIPQENNYLKEAHIHDIRYYSYFIENVSFGYDEENTVIKDKTFKFEENKINVIYGKSGSGKSTLLKLMIRLYDVKNGGIFLDNININKFDIEEYRDKIAYLPQDIFLLENTIYKNLKLVDENITEQKMWDILDKLSIKKEIEQIANGIHADIGEKGGRLSGGQRQRIILAMSLLKQAEIIIFDEPTSALDTENTYSLMNLLGKIKQNHTIIITSHDNIIKEFADIIYDFDAL